MIQSQGSASLVRQPKRFRPISQMAPVGGAQPPSYQNNYGDPGGPLLKGGNHRITDQAPGVGPQPYQPNGPAAQPLPPLTNPGMAPNVTQVGPAGNPEGGGLRGDTYLPGNDPRLAGAQGRVDAAGAAIHGAPSISDETETLYGRYRPLLSGGQTRFDAAKGVLQNLDENQGLARTHGIRQIGQSAAALGRTGAGMTTNDLTGLEATLDRNREQNLRQLSADTTEGDINDRFRTLDAGFQGANANTADRYRRLDAARGVESQVFGEGQSNRDEYRTERGRQDTQGQQGIENRLRERRQQQAEMEARWRRAMGMSDAGGMGTPSLEEILKMQGG